MASLEYTVKYTVKWTMWYRLFQVLAFCFGGVKSKGFERAVTWMIKDKKVATTYVNNRICKAFYFKDFLPND